MKLVTWNVGSLNARLFRVLEFLGEHVPDVICLQETKCDADAFGVDELAAAGYHGSIVRPGAGRGWRSSPAATPSCATPVRALPRRDA